MPSLVGSEMCIRDSYVAAARRLTVRSSADTRTSTARGRYLRPPHGRSPRKVYIWHKRARKIKRHSVRNTNHQSLHNSFHRPESTPRTCAFECCTQSSIVRNVQPRTQVISPGPVANGETQCRPQAGAPPATPAAVYASPASRSSLQQKHTPAEEAHSGKSSLRGKNLCARTATGSDDRSRDRRNEPRVTLKIKFKLKLKPTGS